MSYFFRLGKASFEIDGREYILDDVTRRVVNDPRRFFNNTYTEEYNLQNGTRPDIVASELYNNVNFWWTMFILNNMTYNDWPLGDTELEESITRKYSEFQLNQVVRYEDDEGNQLPSHNFKSFISDGEEIVRHFNRGRNFFTSNPLCGVAESNGNKITLRESLIRENEDKRLIRVVKRDRILEFVTDFDNIIRGPITP